MEEQEKPFDIVSIVLLMLLAFANDGLEIFFDILAATGVGLAGEAIMEPINAFFDGLFTVIFFWKLGFGWPTTIQLIDDALEPFGVPGRIISVAGGMWLANHPKSKIGQLAQLATVAEGGELALEEAGVSGELGTLNEAPEISQTETGQKTSYEQKVRGTGVAVPEEEKEDETEGENAREEELERMMEAPAERNPMENVYEESFENTGMNDLPPAIITDDTPENVRRFRELHEKAQELPEKFKKEAA